MKHRVLITAFLSLLMLSAVSVSQNGTDSSDHGNAILWQDPGNIAVRDLYYGPGGPDKMPRAPFKFLEEDMGGTTPKFDVVDANGTEWKVKMGVEARPEVAAARLVWSVGYFAQVNYFVPRLEVQNMPARLKRGQELVLPGSVIHGVRLKKNPEGAKSAGHWRWKQNSFSGTSEFNGLRVMMTLISNLDVKDENNRIFRVREANGELIDIHMVSDLGASFSEHLWPYEYKGNLRSYKNVEFVRKVDADTVDFNLPTGPKVVDLAHIPWRVHRAPLRWIGRNIPRADAKWIGQKLGELSPKQIQDAFRAAGFPEEEVQGFANEVLERIEALNAL